MSRFSTNRTTVAGQTVRFFMERRQSIGEANALTQASSEQHNSVGVYLDETNTSHVGYLIENVVKKTFQDTDGVLPEAVISAVRLRR